MGYPRLIESVIDHMSALPGIGRRSAERIAFWCLNTERDRVMALAQSLVDLKDQLQFCQQCYHLTDESLCDICRNPHRDKDVICVVEDPKDVIAIEKTGSFKGLYHVLLGTIHPSEGRGPEDLTIAGLQKRLQADMIREVIIATDSDSEGEMTALYLIKLFKDANVQVSRISFGIPVGGSVEFADMSSLSESITARRML